MEPPKPQIRSRYNAAPNFTPEEAMEYERLLAQRFQVDPDMQKNPATLAEERQREQRILELHQKIYGAVPAGSR